jgi:hypothetical protein
MLVIAVMIPTSIWAEQLNPYSLGISRPVIINDKDSADSGANFTLRIKGTEPGKIFIEIVDIYVDSSNSKKTLALGSTPYSPKGFVFAEKSEIEYQPSGEFDSVNIRVVFENVEDLDKSIIGGVRVTAKTNEELSKDEKVEGIAVGFNAVGTFSYLPEGALGIEPNLRVLEKKFDYVGSEFILFRFLPDFKNIMNNNKLAISYQIKNEGNIALSAVNQVTIRKVSLNPFNASEEEVVFDQKDEAVALFPSEFSQKRFPLALVDQQSEIRFPALDPIGVYRVDTVVEGKVVNDLLATTESSERLIVFPWKIFVYLFLFIAIRAFIKSRRVKRDVSESVTQEIPIVDLDPEIERMLEAIKPVKKKKVAKKQVPVKKKQVAKVAKKPVKKVAKKAVKKKVKAKS